jgi:transposase
MVSIHKIKNREGVVYVRMYEGWRENGKTKTAVVKNFGRLDKLEGNGWGTFEELQTRVRNGEIPYKSRRKQIIKRINLDESIGDVKLLDYGHLLLDGLFDSLNISSSKGCEKYDVLEILKFLSVQRVVNPKSKRATFNAQTCLIDNKNYLANDIYRSLTKFDKIKEQVQLDIHKSISKSIGRDALLVFYDVTNYYFEADLSDRYIDEAGEVVLTGLRQCGCSKEKRSGSPIVQMGLFMDINGIPIAYKLFCGNCHDSKTYLAAIEQVKRQFGIKRIVTVADKAMNSDANIASTLKNGDGYLFSSKFRGLRGSRKNLQEFALKDEGWKTNEDHTFAVKSGILTRKTGKNSKVEEKVVVTWRLSYEKRQKHRRNGAISYVQNMRPAQMKRVLLGKNESKYFDISLQDLRDNEIKYLNPRIKIDDEKVKFDEQFDGMNIIVTSELDMSDDDIIRAYGELNKIEDCFRVTKTNLQTRPVFIWTPPHIEAHFLTCFIALVMIKVLQHKLKGKFSVHEIIDAMKSAKAKHIVDDYYDTSCNEIFQEICAELGIKWNKRNNKLEKFDNLKKVSL